MTAADDQSRRSPIPELLLGERHPLIRTGQRDPISPLLRQLVYRRDRWTCRFCGASPHATDPARRSGPLHLDHILPWSAGGADRSDNLRTLCEDCNQTRSNHHHAWDKPATPIVGICTPCLVTAEPRYTSLLHLPDRFDVYCGHASHHSWAVRGWRII